MRILLDTHLLRWAVGARTRMPAAGRDEVEDPLVT